MAKLEEMLKIRNPNRLLRNYLSELYPDYFKNAPSGEKPTIYYNELLTQFQIFVPILLTGVGPYNPYLITDEYFYWIDERAGYDNFRAIIKGEDNTPTLNVSYLIRYGQEVIAALKRVPVTVEVPYGNRVYEFYKNYLNFIEGQAKNHEEDLKLIYDILELYVPRTLRTIIGGKPLPLSQIHCEEYKDF